MCVYVQMQNSIHRCGGCMYGILPINQYDKQGNVNLLTPIYKDTPNMIRWYLYHEPKIWQGVRNSLHVFSST